MFEKWQVVRMPLFSTLEPLHDRQPSMGMFDLVEDQNWTLWRLSRRVVLVFTNQNLANVPSRVVDYVKAKWTDQGERMFEGRKSLAEEGHKYEECWAYPRISIIKVSFVCSLLIVSTSHRFCFDRGWFKFTCTKRTHTF